MKTIKRILLSVLLLQTTCQILPAETTGEQASSLASTIGTGIKNGLYSAGSTIGTFAWKQAQAHPLLTVGMTVGIVAGAANYNDIRHTIKSINRKIRRNYKKAIAISVAISSSTSFVLGVLLQQQVKDGLNSACTTILSYLPTSNVVAQAQLPTA